MKSATLRVATLWVALGVAIVPAYAQRGGIHARIPFNFAVTGQIFPAGEYILIAASQEVRIEDATGRVVAMVLANDISGRSAGANGEIIFHCYRDRCFLAEVWSPAQMNGRELPRSRAEANLAKEEKGKYFAVLGERAPSRP